MTRRKDPLPPSLTAGGSPSTDETADSPHASRGISWAARRAAIGGGVTDSAGNPTEREQEAVRQAREAVVERDPAVMILRDEHGRMSGPYADPHTNHLRMLAAFGTNSDFFVVQRIHELNWMLARRAETTDPDQPALNAGLAVVNGVAPENEMEAMLAVQMAGTHALACEMTGRAMRTDRLEQMNCYVNAATKLQRTFTAQLEALARMRGKGQQTVRVEHVTVEPGAQAIVGDVHHHHPKEKIDGAATGAGPRASLPSPDPLGNGVPIGGDAERSVPHARRGQHRRAARKSERAQARILHPERDP